MSLYYDYLLDTLFKKQIRIESDRILTDLLSRIYGFTEKLSRNEILMLKDEFNRRVNDVYLTEKINLYFKIQMSIKTRKIKKDKAKVDGRLKRIKSEKKLIEFAKVSTKALRKFNDKKDDIEQTERIVKRFEQEYQDSKNKTYTINPKSKHFTENEEDPIHRK